jgi:hypothetical protein
MGLFVEEYLEGEAERSHAETQRRRGKKKKIIIGV